MGLYDRFCDDPVVVMSKRQEILQSVDKCDFMEHH